MGYSINTTPGPRWFMSRSIVLQPLKDLVALEKTPPSPSILALIHLQKIRLDLARGILLMTGKVAQSGSIYENLKLAAEHHQALHREWGPRLVALANPGFAVSYGGTGQYNVPNYDLRRGDERERATGELGPLYHAAFEERLAHAKSLKGLVVEMLCEIYLAERSYDHNYYSYWETIEEDSRVLETCIRRGVFADEAAALAACDGDLERLRRLEIVKDLGKRLNREYWAEYHEEQWYRFNELDAMWHGCSD